MFDESIRIEMAPYSPEDEGEAMEARLLALLKENGCSIRRDLLYIEIVFPEGTVQQDLNPVWKDSYLLTLPSGKSVAQLPCHAEGEEPRYFLYATA